jgi:hypothetical protein
MDEVSIGETWLTVINTNLLVIPLQPFFSQISLSFVEPKFDVLLHL